MLSNKCSLSNNTARLLICILVLALAHAHGSAQQKTTARTALENKRLSIMQEINQTKQLIAQTSNTAKGQINKLRLLENQLNARKEIIRIIEQEAKEINTEISKKKQEIQQQQTKLEQKKNKYADLIRALAKKRAANVDKLLFILAADNAEQAYRRMKYINQYADWQKQQAQEIIQNTEQLTKMLQQLEKTNEEKQTLLAEKQNESNSLTQEQNKQKKQIADIDKQQSKLQETLKQQEQQATQLNKQIEQLIAKEIERASSRQPQTQNKEPETNKFTLTEEELNLSKNFASNKGKLPYPVNNKSIIVGKFGVHQHSQLKYVKTNNSGIDIQTVRGANAICVFNGVVSTVFSVDGYNKSVIVRHGNYLTVYANLEEVFVKQGQTVKTLQEIGRIHYDQSTSSCILHFQLWKERAKQNPQPWLRKQ